MGAVLSDRQPDRGHAVHRVQGAALEGKDGGFAMKDLMVPFIQSNLECERATLAYKWSIFRPNFFNGPRHIIVSVAIHYSVLYSTVFVHVLKFKISTVCPKVP